MFIIIFCHKKERCADSSLGSSSPFRVVFRAKPAFHLLIGCVPDQLACDLYTQNMRPTLMSAKSGNTILLYVCV